MPMFRNAWENQNALANLASSKIVYNALDKERNEFQRMKENLQQAKEYLPVMRQEKYGEFLKFVKDIGGPVQLLPDEKDVISMPPDQFDKFKQGLVLGADKIGQMDVEKYKSTLREAEEKTKQQNRTSLAETQQKGKVEIANINKMPTVGDTKKIQMGNMEVTQEWTGKEWKEVGKGPKWNTNSGQQKERRPSDIKKDIVNMEKTRQQILSTGAVGEMAFSLMAMSNPELAKEIQGMDSKRAISAIDDAIKELYKELPEESRPTETAPESNALSWRNWQK